MVVAIKVCQRLVLLQIDVADWEGDVAREGACSGRRMSRGKALAVELARAHIDVQDAVGLSSPTTGAQGRWSRLSQYHRQLFID